MAKTLEELIVKIDADIGSFKKNLSDAEKRSGDSGKKISSAFSTMGKGISGAFGSLLNLRNLVMGGALVYMMKQSLDAADATAKLSKNIGISSKFFQEMSFAASQSGVEQATLNTSLQIFNRTIGQAAIGNETVTKKFKELGIAVKDTDDKVRTTEDIFLDVSKAMSQMSSQAEKAAYAQELFGRGGASMVNMLEGGPEKIQAFQKEAERLGLVLGDRLLGNAEKAKDEMDKLQRVIGAQLNTVFLEMSPILIAAASNLVNLVASARPAIVTFAGLTETLLHMLGVTDNIPHQLADIEREIKKLENEFSRAGEKAFNFKGNLLDAGNSAEESTKKQASLRAEIDRLKQRYDELTRKALDQADAQRSIQGVLEESKKKMEELREQQETNIKTVKDADEEEAKIINDKIARIELLKEIKNANFDEEQLRLQEDVIKYQEAQWQKAAASQNLSTSQLQILKKQKDEEKKIKDKGDDEEKKRIKERWDGAKTALNNLSVLQQSKSKEMQTIGKAAAISEALISTYAGATKAFTSLAGIPIVGPALGAAAAAAAVVAGLARVQQIRGIPFKEGGLVPGTGFGDKVPALLEPKEMVVSRDTTKDLQKFLNAQLHNMSPNNGSMRVEIGFKDEAFELIEVKLLERKRIGIASG